MWRHFLAEWRDRKNILSKVREETSWGGMMRQDRRIEVSYCAIESWVKLQ